jgi:oxygen-independent coproporphyrinogen-3 oxidase
MTFSEAIPLSLYVHLPWCVSKCPYCDFNSHALPQKEVPERRYIDALIADLEQELPRVWGRSVSSIFIGGGTPSLFSPEAIDRLLQAIRARLPLIADTEITMEANPGSVEQARFAEFFSAGINRLSIGIQSFETDLLQRLGRIHNGEDAHRAIDVAMQAGFNNVNLDLMFSLPGQSLEQLSRDVRTAVGYDPAHISFYQLTLEPNTAFYVNPPARIPADEKSWSMQVKGRDLLQDAGFRQYEVSAFSQVGRQCRHNRNYWEFGDYLGIGAGAHGKYTDMAAGRIHRSAKIRQPARYMDSALAGNGISDKQSPDHRELQFEFMLNALRLTEGFSEALFSERTGLDWSVVECVVQEGVDDGLLEKKLATIRSTDLGLRFLNDMLMRFLPDET